MMTMGLEEMREDDDEVPRLRQILNMLDGMTEVISEMKIAAEKVMKGR